MANHRIGGQRVGWRFGIIPESLNSAMVFAVYRSKAQK
jgi:hypothetical protein